MHTQSTSTLTAVATAEDTEDRPIVVRARRIFTDAIARNTLRDRLDGASDDDLALVARAGHDVDSRTIARELLRERCETRLGRLSRDEFAEVSHKLVMRRSYGPYTTTVEEDLLAIMGGAQ